MENTTQQLVLDLDLKVNDPTQPLTTGKIIPTELDNDTVMELNKKDIEAGETDDTIHNFTDEDDIYNYKMDNDTFVMENEEWRNTEAKSYPWLNPDNNYKGEVYKPTLRERILYKINTTPPLKWAIIVTVVLILDQLIDRFIFSLFK